jgi:hypothetical protein
MDLQIWYSIWSSGVGAFVGLLQHLGEVRLFSLIITVFCIRLLLDICLKLSRKCSIVESLYFFLSEF